MPKMKTNRAAKKRFKVSSAGKIIREHAFASHKFTSKPQKRKRRLRKMTTIAGSDARRVRRLLGA